MIVDALQAAQRLKPGLSRSQVDEDFELDGGISFPQQPTYVYKKCRYIKIDLSFGAEDITRRPNASPRDTVRQISKLYLAYPVAD